MVSLLKKSDEYPVINKAVVTPEEIVVDMSDGRHVKVPIGLFPRLLNATPQQRLHMEVSPSGYGIHWPDIDEDISVKAFL